MNKLGADIYPDVLGIWNVDTIFDPEDFNMKYIIVAAKSFRTLNYLQEGWPFKTKSCSDWIFCNNIQRSNIDPALWIISFHVPMDYNIDVKDKLYPLNQFEKGVENKELLDWIEIWG